MGKAVAAIDAFDDGGYTSDRLVWTVMEPIAFGHGGGVLPKNGFVGLFDKVFVPGLEGRNRRVSWRSGMSVKAEK